MTRRRKKFQRRLALPLLVSVAVLGAVYGLVLRPQWSTLNQARQDLVDARVEEDYASRTADRAKEADADLMNASNALAQAEFSMAQGDVFSWAVRTFEAMKTDREMHLTQIDPPDFGDPIILPKVPYSFATFTVHGRASYMVLGKLIADFENQFPFARLARLEMHAPGASRGDFDNTEDLRFQFDVTIPVKVEAAVK